jgi:hypothetical protein
MSLPFLLHLSHRIFLLYRILAITKKEEKKGEKALG